VDVHVPKLEEHDAEPAGLAPAAAAPPRGRRSVLKIALEITLIAVGVFFGLAGEQWRERGRHRELAAASLRRFRSEVETNRAAAAAVRDYHAKTFDAMQRHLAADARVRDSIPVRIQGLRPALFEHTAWDVALATQSLADIDPDLVFALSRLYNAQQAYADLTRGILQALYIKPPSENEESFLQAAAVYYGDIVLMEPRIIDMCDQLLPQIDRALGKTR